MGQAEIKRLEEALTNDYGESSIPESVLQKLWFKGDFIQEGLRTHSGKMVKIVDPGNWNKLEGPDFKGAKIEVDGKMLYGDVEIHFHAKDWHTHRHERDSNYSNVILHVVLFEPSEGVPLPYNEYGYCPEVLILLDKLYSSLEEYASEKALLEINERDTHSALEGFLMLSGLDQWMLLQDRAKERWTQKLRFAGLRLRKHSFEEALHISILEILGYRRNRGVMSDIALRYPRAYFGGKDPRALFDEFRGKWTLRGLRPPNHPLKRLTQYNLMLKEKPNYDELLLRLAKTLPPGNDFIEGTREYRKRYETSKTREKLQDSIFSGQIRSTRLDTLVIDGLLPLLSKHLERDLFQLWFHWYPGDISELVTQTLSTTKIQQSSSNGLNQGTLQLILRAGLG